MEQYEKELHINRIRSGYTIIGDIRILPPTPRVEYEASIINREIMLDESLMGETEMLQYLIEEGMWTTKDQEEIGITEKHIEYWKGELFTNFFYEGKRETMRGYLRAAEQHLFSLLNKRSVIESYCKMGIANYSKNIYIFMNSAFYEDGTKVDWSIHDVTAVMNKYYNATLQPKQLRELAKSPIWSSLWSIYSKSGKQMFENIHLTAEQQQLIQWTSVYENVYSSQDCPSDEVINDDDAIDGWFIAQGKKRKQYQNEAMIRESNSNFGKHAENYIMAENKEQAEKIMSMNSPQAMAVMKSRLKQVEKMGTIKEQDLMDIKQSIMMAHNRR
jgi:hypothetical protein